MARRFGRDGWQGLESPQILMKALLIQGAAETGRASAGGTAMGEKFIEFQFIETGLDFLLYIWRKNWQWKQLRER